MSMPTVQDRHLDTLLTLALEQMEREENDRLARSADPEVEAADAVQMDRAFESACQTARREQRSLRRMTRAKKAGRVLRLVGMGAAAAVFLLLLAFPAALGASAEFRAYVMQMLVQVDREQNTVSILFQPEEAIASPDQWTGRYFPRYIPDGFAFSGYDEKQGQAAFASPTGQRFSFSEHAGPMPSPEIPEGAFSMPESLHGGDFPVIEEHKEGLNRITALWEAEGRWFRLEAENMDREEALRIADSVELLSDANDINIDMKGTNPALTGGGVPDWWQGSYYPSALPENSKIVAFNILDNKVELSEASGKSIVFSETDMSAPGAMTITFGAGADFRSVAVNGQKGFLAAAASEENPSVYLFWQTEDAHLALETRGMTAEETLALAESVKKLERTRGGQESAGIVLLRDEAGGVLPPREWSGDCFPAYLPEGFRVNEMAAVGLSCSLGLVGPQKETCISIRESSYFPSSMPYLDQLTDARLVRIGDGQGLFIQGGEAAASPLWLYWQPEENRWMELQTSHLPEEEALRIASSVRPCGASGQAFETLP